MTIIKEGNPKLSPRQIVRFSCQHCGCIFEEEADNCIMDIMHNWGGEIVVSRRSEFCPWCGMIASTEVKIDDKTD